ncbi:MAG TPA: ABC transporter ATP-binding protein [Spirochaetia bacterium]|nr:ABC transporter ATP-binding protein [Spirochaetia bacterium]
MLHIEGLAKSYGELRALRGVDLHVAPGEVCGLIGPNGAGKTTLVSIVTGLRDADAGSVRVAGLDVSAGARANRKAVRRLIGCAPQELGLYPTISVRANMEFFGRWNGVTGHTLQERIGEVADTLDLADLLNRRAGDLSGGQKRRLHTGLALLHSPRLLFLDEPTVGADVVARMRLLEAVKKIAARGCAVVYATHYLAEIESLGASVALLEGGVIVERGPLADVVSRHGQARAELEFTGDAPRLEGWQQKGSRLLLMTPDPASATAAAMTRLNGDSARLRGVRIVPASLESAYLSITGHGVDSAETTEGDNAQA